MSSKKAERKKDLYLLIFIAVILVVIEAIAYYATGKFIICGRYSGCTSASGLDLTKLVVLLAILICWFKFLNKKLSNWATNLYEYMFGQTSHRSMGHRTWFLAISSILFIFASTGLIVFVYDLIIR